MLHSLLLCRKLTFFSFENRSARLASKRRIALPFYGRWPGFVRIPLRLPRQPKACHPKVGLASPKLSCKKRTCENLLT